ncbi:ATP-dependent DNA helicase [Desulforhopalus singaporensis]|uniref:PIF1-like helicase n=1 Tax=Desulforhopalus singaporensis TaxID=91360 RepID=A0A1H0UB67_9BACT|nr:DEAD/DEAH box helicase [Desulforhopalus singaporensis]SDP63429.1 PIF1-like helicase [Desulforhopalus singaporensis]
MDPFTLIAVATAAGFVFNKMSGSSVREERREFTYSRDLVARLKPDNRSEFDLAAIDVLKEYRLVKKLVDNQFPLVFITGGAGTGKSTFVRWAMKEFAGSVLLGAPTANAAITAGGKTLHSLFQLPTGWIVKSHIKKAPQKREFREAKLLIIDEVSMVTANLLDGISAFLRVNRGVNAPFGGLPVIMVGDMFQLPPVVTKDIVPLYKKIYGSPKFYNARCLQQATYYGVELTRTYRQSDQEFVDILTRLREGVDLKNSVAHLNSRCTITDRVGPGTVWLSPRNREVDFRNSEEMTRLSGTARSYRGLLSGQFSGDRLPAPTDLTVKVGAQIMFTRNDVNKRWINGSIGVVRRLLNDKIFIELAETGKIVDVGRVKWTDYHYFYNKKSNRIDRTRTGSYQQFPLVPAWASTIHKSQGKTIENVHLDLGAGSFETGQTYVALSRCRSLSGLTLSRPLTVADIIVDYESKQFYDGLRQIIKKLPPKKMMQTLAG